MNGYQQMEQQAVLDWRAEVMTVMERYALWYKYANDEELQKARNDMGALLDKVVPVTQGVDRKKYLEMETE